MLVPSWSPMEFQSVFPAGVETAEGPWVGARPLVWPLAAAFLVFTPVNSVKPVYSSCHTAFNICHSSLPLTSPKLLFPEPRLFVLPAPVLSSQPWLPLFVKIGLNLMPPALLFRKPLHDSFSEMPRECSPRSSRNYLTGTRRTASGVVSLPLPMMARCGMIASRAHKLYKLHQCRLDRQIAASFVESLQRIT